MSEDLEKRAPVQGYSAGIPWSMHLRAYDAYCKRYRPQPALIEGGCRGGFGTEELDMFIPGWREELSEIAALREKLAAVEGELLCLGEFVASYNRDEELQSLMSRNNELLARAEAAEARATAAEAREVTPEMLAAAWRAWHSRHGGRMGPGPAFKEAIEAALAVANG